MTILLLWTQLVQPVVDTLKQTLDNPAIDYRKFVVGAGWAICGLETYILSRQLPMYTKPSPPALLASHIPADTYQKSQAYGRDRSRFGIFRQLVDQLSSWGMIVGGVYLWGWDKAGSTLAKLGVDPTRVIPRSLVYTAVLVLISSITSIPLSMYSTFVIEERHGFNKSTLKLFVMDTLKGWLVGAVIGMPFLAAFLTIIDWAGDSFVPYLMVFFLVFTVLIQIIYPTFIQPLFNKLTPLPEGELRTRVEALAGSLQFPLKHLYVIDGSKRSGHSNAYFYGLPWSKHIVIYDTLIEQSTPEEVEAVLAHELGHWKRGHVTKLLMTSQLYLFATLTLFTLFINNRALFSSFGFNDSVLALTQAEKRPIIIGFMLFQLVTAPLDPLASLGMNALSRKYEYEADEFAADLNKGPQLSRALIKIMNENLASPHNDWLYSMYKHSHPTLVERLSRLNEYERKVGHASQSVTEVKKEL
ncbi:zinc metalloprotease [Naganishia albida]|nr:zinc metalloprotease [Naganishia albida]